MTNMLTDELLLSCLFYFFKKTNHILSRIAQFIAVHIAAACFFTYQAKFYDHSRHVRSVGSGTWVC